MLIQFITFIAYIIVIILIGYAASYRVKTQSDFILAQRQLGPLATALGVGASDMGGWLVMALPGVAFQYGLNQIWLPISLSLGAYINWKFVAKRLRESSLEYNDSQTIPSYFHHRLGGEGSSLKMISSVLILFFFTFYIASGFVASALLLQSVFHWSYWVSLLVGGLVIILYCLMGGFLAVNWVDVFQGLLMLFSFLIVAAIITTMVGSFHGMQTYFQKQSPSHLALFSDFSWLNCLSLLGWGLGYFGQPHILVRFMAARHPEQISLSRKICMSWMLISVVATFVIGFSGFVYFKGHLSDPEAVLLRLSEVALNPWIAGLLFSAILSTIMSTVAAQLLVSCSTVTEDILGAIKNKFGNESLQLSFNRIVLGLVAIVAFLISLNPQTNLFHLVGYAWAGFGATFGPVLLMCLYSKRITKKIALLGMLSGAFVTIIWHILGIQYGGIFNLYEMIPGFIANLSLMILASCQALCVQHFRKTNEFKRKINEM